MNNYISPMEPSIMESGIMEPSIMKTNIIEIDIMETVIKSPIEKIAKVELTDEDKLIKVKKYINGFKTQIESLKKTNKQLLECIESFKKTNKQLYDYLDEKNQQMFSILVDNDNNISAIENNMKRHYVENWTVTDSNGIPGNFCGNIKWIKGGGTIHYINRTYFKGAWDSTGEITNGTLFNHMHDVIKKWKYGTLVEDDESDTEDELRELYYEIYP